MRRMIILSALLSLFVSSALRAQITDVYAGNDTIELQVGNYQYGFVQWQTSKDMENWENVEGATDVVYRFLPTENAYYRALAFFDNCPDVTSRVCHVQVPPKADAGPDRKLMEGDGATMFALLEEGCVGEWEIIEGANGVLDDPSSPNAYFEGTDEEYKLKWTVTNACGSTSDTITIRYCHTVLNENFIVIDTTDVILSDSTQLLNGLYIVSFSDPQPQINENSVVIGIGEKSFMRKTVHHEVVDGIHYIETVEATLDDILLDGVLSIDFRSYLSGRGNKRVIMNRLPTRKELMENKGDCIYIGMRGQEDSNGAKFTINCKEGGDGTLSWKLGNFTLPGDALITPTLTLTPNIVWELDRWFVYVRHFKFGLYNSSLLTGKVLEIPGKTSFSLPLHTIDLPTVPEFYIWWPIAGVPVKFSVKITAAVKQSASYSMGPRMSYTATQRTVLTSFIEYNDDSGWNSDFNLSKIVSLSLELPDYGNFSYELSVGPKFSFLIYDLFGPYFTFKLYGKMTGRFDGPHNKATNATIGLKGDIGAQLRFTDNISLDGSFPLIDAKFFEVDDPFFMEVYSGNNQMYTPGEWLLDDIKVKVYNSRGNVSGSTKVRFETNDGSLSSEYATTGAYDGIAKVRWRPAATSTGEITLRAYLYNLKDEPLQCVPVVIRAYQGASVPSCANSTLSLRAEYVNGSIKLEARGGSDPYLFSTDGVSFSPTIPPVIPVEGRTYHFYVRDRLNCVKDCYYTHPTFDCSKSDLTLTVSQQGNTVTATAYKGKSPYKYSLDNGSYSSTNVFSNLMNGRHVVYVRDANGCEEAEVITINASGSGGGGGSGGGASVTVTTSPTVNVMDATSAHGSGSVSVTGNATVSIVGLCWSTHHAPTTSDEYVQQAYSGNSFGNLMINLTPGVMYYLRAYAVTNTGTVYGNEVGFSTTAVAPVVTCSGVGNTTSSSVRALGNVSNINGVTVTERGFCWSRSHNPTVSGNHLACGSGTGVYSGNITGLEPDTRYYLRAYAKNSVGTSYSDEVSFRTFEGGGGGFYNGYEYIDLGLPSGLLWATCNVGANAPEEYGDYFAWGETMPKNYYYWNTYQHCMGSDHSFTKYCLNSDFGYNGFTDDLTTLLPEDDAATANWGDGWRMPTKEEWDELYNNTTCTWTTQNGVNGCLFIAPNGNSLFLPDTGRYWCGEPIFSDWILYWSSSLDTDYPDVAWAFDFDSMFGYCPSCPYRCTGLSVRPVHSVHQK